MSLNKLNRSTVISFIQNIVKMENTKYINYVINM